MFEKPSFSQPRMSGLICFDSNNIVTQLHNLKSCAQQLHTQVPVAALESVPCCPCQSAPTHFQISKLGRPEQKPGSTLEKFPRRRRAREHVYEWPRQLSWCAFSTWTAHCYLAQHSCRITATSSRNSWPTTFLTSHKQTRTLCKACLLHRRHGSSEGGKEWMPSS